MRTYVTFVLIALGSDLISKFIILCRQDTQRSMSAVVIDGLITSILLIWGAFILEGN